MGRPAAASLLLLLLLLTMTGRCVELALGKVCSAKQLSVLSEVSDQVSQCQRDSRVSFQMPPSSSLSKTQQVALCTSQPCNNMIGAVDDLELPRCETTFDSKNMTLQESLDKFAATCDAITRTPSPIKRKSSGSSASAGGSGSLPKGSQDRSRASVVRFGTSQQIASLVAIGISIVAAVVL
ncbi:hypothetical protein BBJ28_00014528 [Nothophytophthora sp. Chile5]|nr:hypothetical protein BBJ28_00014528 [Nothophytophthora sp. Chile5]